MPNLQLRVATSGSLVCRRTFGGTQRGSRVGRAIARGYQLRRNVSERTDSDTLHYYRFGTVPEIGFRMC